MKDPQAGFPDQAVTLGSLLRAPYRRLQQQLYADLAEKFPEVRRAHSVVFRHIAADGSRLTDLAEQAEMSKQSMAYLIGHLARYGYVRTEDHPEDGRARRVRLTAKGLRFMEAALVGSERLERVAREQMGPDKVQALRKLLQELGQALAGSP
jgi:DNA-binding MarR family transcriptional regulator